MATDPLYRVRTILSGWQGGQGLSTCYFSAPAGGNSTDALTAANRVRGSWDVVKGLLPSAVTAQTIGQVDMIDSATGSLMGSFAVTQPAVVTGTGVGNVGPPQVAGGLELFTADVVNGRRVRGRLFISPLVSAQTVTATPSAGCNSALDAMGVALVTVSPPATPALVVWHRPKGHPASGGSNFNVLSSGHATKFFTLRSRLN